MRRARPLAALALIAMCCPSVADSSQTTALKVWFSPNRLGHATSVSFSARIFGSSPSGVPAPLSQVSVRYPSVLGVALSGLGLATCRRARLEALGPVGCPANSLVGRGEVIVAVPFGPQVVHERARVTIVRAPEREEGIALLFYAEGSQPVSAEITFTGILSEANDESEVMRIDVPLIEGLAGGPDVAVIRLEATLGPIGLTYLERVHGQLVPYHPRGILLPARCPPQGFQFGSDFDFLDGSTSTARATIACGTRHRRAQASLAHTRPTASR